MFVLILPVSSAPFLGVITQIVFIVMMRFYLKTTMDFCAIFSAKLWRRLFWKGSENAIFCKRSLLKAAGLLFFEVYYRLFLIGY